MIFDGRFSEDIIRWQQRYGRHALPWQNTRDAYRIWLSEIMLQQTQVNTVIPYYIRFLTRFPDIQTLADSSIEEVMAHWSGLGYYSRARNVHKCAHEIVHRYRGFFPSDPKELVELPGIGRSTAAAISVFAYGFRSAILDGNVKRVFARFFGVVGYPSDKQVETILWEYAELHVPSHNIEQYTQGLMDMGATLCVRSKPLCSECPIQKKCVAYCTNQVNSLPTPKLKKTIPEKYIVMLVLVCDERILLEKRPDKGIWGGLFSLPEIDPERGMEGILSAAKLWGAVSSCVVLPSFSHRFTHFKLHVTPYRIDLLSEENIQPNYVWIEKNKVLTVALPAPIKKLIPIIL